MPGASLLSHRGALAPAGVPTEVAALRAVGLGKVGHHIEIRLTPNTSRRVPMVATLAVKEFQHSCKASTWELGRLIVYDKLV